MIPIGKVIKPHGVKGFLKIKSETDFKDTRFQIGARLLLTGVTSQTVTVKSYAYQPNMELISFEEINDRDAAEKVVGSTIEVDESVQKELPEDEFYYQDLNGLDVIYQAQKIGTVIDVMDYPQGAMLRIQLADKTVLVPFLKAFVERVDIHENTLELIHWDGLL
jgi:16S rRNA processing protein RimM